MKLNILLLCNKPNTGKDANTIVDHIEAIENYSQHNVWCYSNVGDLAPHLELERFDVVIIHYSVCLLHNYYLSQKSKERLREYSGLKVVFIQDEYRQINRMISELAYLKIDVLFTCFPEQEVSRVYQEDKLPKVAKYTNLTGYVPERLLKRSKEKSIKERPIHVGYRGRQLPYWYGELAYEKWNIVEKWFQHTHAEDIKVDISYHEKDRIYGNGWIDFVSSCKTTLGVESGASVMDFTGELEKTIDFYQLTHPNASFQEVQKKFLLEKEGQYKLNQISPRCFEAIALKTALILYEGEYSGILVPGRHYIELKKDFSNIQEVLHLLKDDNYLQYMVDVTYEEIALNPQYSYRQFVHSMDNIMSAEFMAQKKTASLVSYDFGLFQKHIKKISLKSRVLKWARTLYQALPSSIRLLIKTIVRPKSTMKSCVKWVYLLNAKYNERTR